MVCEPVFVPDPRGTREDSGWLLCQVYDAGRDRTFLSVLDAAEFGKEHARVTLSHPLPYLLHGKFVCTVPPARLGPAREGSEPSR